MAIKRVLINAIEGDETGGTGVRLIMQKFDPEDGQVTNDILRFSFQNGKTDEQIEAINLRLALDKRDPLSPEQEAAARTYIPTALTAQGVNKYLIEKGYPPLDADQVTYIEALRVLSRGNHPDIAKNLANGVPGAVAALMDQVSKQAMADNDSLTTQVKNLTAQAEI